MNFTDRVHHALVNHGSDLQRYSADLQARVAALLNRLGRDLAREIEDAGLDTPRTDWQRARLKALLAATEKQIANAYGEVADLHQEEMASLVEISRTAIAGIVNEAAGADLLLAQRWSAQRLAAIAGDTLINGAPSSDWWGRQAGGLAEAFADQLRQGMLRGETITQLRRRIMYDTDLRKVAPESRPLFWAARRDAEALVRTSTMAVANQANLETYRDNADLVEGVQWVATLDTRTCPTCGVLDGKTWDLGDEGHPVPPRHWSCRCVLVPVTKSWEQLAREAHGNSRLGRALDEMAGGTRSSMDGQVAGGMTYQEWFGKQSRTRQEEILGPERMKLWDAGRIQFQQLVDGKGSPMTLEQLRERWGA